MPPSECPICHRIYCDHTHVERGQTFAQMMGDTFPEGVSKKQVDKLRKAWFKHYPAVKELHQRMQMIIPQRVNEAIDKGWRLREAGPLGVWCLVPPEAYEADLGLSIKEANTFQLIIPSKELDDWLTAREPLEPDDELRKEKKAKVQAWFHQEWNNYVRECEDDENYAADVILDDAASDFSMEEETELLQTWLEEVRNSRT